MLDILFFFVQFGILTPKMGILTYESHARNFVNKMGTHILWAPNMAYLSGSYGLPFGPLISESQPQHDSWDNGFSLRLFKVTAYWYIWVLSPY